MKTFILLFALTTTFTAHAYYSEECTDEVLKEEKKLKIKILEIKSQMIEILRNLPDGEKAEHDPYYSRLMHEKKYLQDRADKIEEICSL